MLRQHRILEKRMYDDRFGYSDLVPESIRKTFMWLCQDVVSLRRQWEFYLRLFSSKRDTALLSELAPGSFAIIAGALRRDMTMAICRLSDPAATGGYSNIALQCLAQECGSIQRFGDLLGQFLEACEPVRRYRNKRVGHRDSDTTLEPQENPIPGVQRGRVDSILELAENSLTVIHQHYVGSSLAFKVEVIGGADALLDWLSLAREANRRGWMVTEHSELVNRINHEGVE